MNRHLKQLFVLILSISIIGLVSETASAAPQPGMKSKSSSRGSFNKGSTWSKHTVQNRGRAPGVSSHNHKSGKSYGRTGPSSPYRNSHSQNSRSYKSHSHNSHRHNYSTYRPSYNKHYYSRPTYNRFAISPYGLSYGYYDSGIGLQFNLPLNRTRNYYYSGYNSYYGSYPNYRRTIYGYDSYLSPNNVAPAYSTPNGLLYQSGVDSFRSTGNALSPAESASANNLLSGSNDIVNPHVEQIETNARDSSTLIPTNSAAAPIQAQAEQAFREGRYAGAVKLANKAISLDRNNPQLMLFASHAKFAIGDFNNAFLEIDAATARLPKEQWATVIKNYPRMYGRDEYVSQMDRLSQYILSNPTRYLARALRGFHYGCLGYEDAARKDLEAAMKINPGDKAVSRIAAGFSTTKVEEITQPVPTTTTLEAPNNVIKNSTLEAPVNTEPEPTNSVLESVDDVVPKNLPSEKDKL